MTITELNKKYTNNELSAIKGDKQLRYEAFSPLFKNLYQNKVIYHERFTAIIKLEDIKLTPDLFEATAVFNLLIKAGARRKRPLPEKWEIGANWAYLSLEKDYFSVYSGWLMWTDPVLVEKVEKLLLENNTDEAYLLTMENL